MIPFGTFLLWCLVQFLEAVGHPPVEMRVVHQGMNRAAVIKRELRCY
jgi:hypothetical protein